MQFNRHSAAALLTFVHATMPPTQSTNHAPRGSFPVSALMLLLPSCNHMGRMRRQARCPSQRFHSPRSCDHATTHPSHANFTARIPSHLSHWQPEDATLSLTAAAEALSFRLQRSPATWLPVVTTVVFDPEARKMAAEISRGVSGTAVSSAVQVALLKLSLHLGRYEES